MPFAAPTATDDDLEKSKDKNGAVNISGESSTFSTGVPGQDAGSGSEKTENGSGAKFANIQSYLDANQSQGDQMGQKIQGTVDSSAQDATQKVNDFQSKAPTVAAYDPSAAYKNITNLSDQDKATYNQNKQGYQGPTSLDKVDGYDDTQKSVSKASTQVGQAGNESGQRQLLKDTYGRPQYTAGENALDQSIVQNSPNSRKGFEDLTQKYSGLSDMFNNAAQSVGKSVNAAQSQGLANQQAIASGEVAARSGLLDPIKQRAADLAASNSKRISDVTNDVSDDTLSADTLSTLGLNEGQNLYNLNLSKYLTTNQTPVGVNNAANADERSRYAALTNLIDGKAGNEITADGQAISPLSFNQDKFKTDLAGTKGEYDSQISNYQNQLNQAHADADAYLRQWGVGSRDELKYLTMGDAGLMGPTLVPQYDQLVARASAPEQQLRNLQSTTGSRVIKKG